MKHEKTLKLLREEIFQKKRHQVDDRTGGKLKFVAATSFQIPIWRITTFRFLSYWAGVTHQDPPFNLWMNWVVGFHVASHDVSVQLSNLIVLPGEDHPHILLHKYEEKLTCSRPKPCAYRLHRRCTWRRPWGSFSRHPDLSMFHSHTSLCCTLENLGKPVCCTQLGFLKPGGGRLEIWTSWFYQTWRNPPFPSSHWLAECSKTSFRTLPFTWAVSKLCSKGRTDISPPRVTVPADKFVLKNSPMVPFWESRTLFLQSGAQPSWTAPSVRWFCPGTPKPSRQWSGSPE